LPKSGDLWNKPRVAGYASSFDDTTESVPAAALFVAADEPLLVFPSVAVAERYLEAIDVENGVYPAAYGPNGEPYRISTQSSKTVISPTGERNRPEDLRPLLINYLQAWKEPFDEGAATSDLVDQVWRFELEMDPYFDRYSTRVPGWCCLVILLIPAGLLFALLRMHPPIVGALIAALLLWPVGWLAKRRADRTDYRSGH